MGVPWEDHHRQCFLMLIWQNSKKTPFNHQGNQNHREVLLTSLQDVKLTRYYLSSHQNSLPSYHPKIKLIYEINPEKFLNTSICYNNSSIATKVHQSVTKLTPNWSPSIRKRYKRNAIHGNLCMYGDLNGDLNVYGQTLTTKRHSSVTEQKMKFSIKDLFSFCAVRQKYDNAGYPSPFTNCLIRDYQHKQNTLFFYKNNFIRTRALYLTKSQEQAKNTTRLAFPKN